MLLALWTTGCSTQQSPTSPSAKSAQEVPSIPPLRWIGDITAIALEWDPNHDPSIAGYCVYRRLKEDNDSSFDRVAKIHDRFTSHYIDLHLPQETKYLYHVTAFNHEGVESKPSKDASTITRPTLRSVVYFDALDKLPRKAKLIWRPHDNGRVNAYVVERKTPAQKEWEPLKKLEHRLSAEYIDNDLKDNQVYLYRIRALTFDKIESTPSDIVKIITKALPVPVSDVNITTDLPHSIHLSWAKHPQKDIEHYRIYRNESATGSFSLFKKTKETTHIDRIDDYGRNFYYKISAVDYDGLESKMDKIYHGANLTRPAKVALHTALIKNGDVTLAWKKGDERTLSYKIIKKEKLGWFKTKETVTTTKETSYATTQKPNISAQYTIYALDVHGIESEPVTTEDLIYEKVVQ